MIRLKSILQEKCDELRKTVGDLKKDIEMAPEGRLNVSFVKNKTRYYHCFVDDKGNSNRIYLRKDQLDLAKALGQKEFEEKAVKAGQTQIETISEFLDKYDPDAVYNVYETLSPARKNLVDAGMLDNEGFIRRWMEVAYEPGKFKEGSPVYLTMKGEKVRSKTEKIMGDHMFVGGYYYRYEYPLKLIDGRIIRPDFLLLDTSARREIILEHFGRMDDPNYVNNSFLPKIRAYLKNGYYPGENLLFTMESLEHPFSTTEFDQLLKHYVG